jgi:cell division septal protein FtsQ
MTARFRPRVGGHARRTKRIRRASAGLSPLRAGAGLAMLLSAAAIYGVSASSVFGFDPARLRIDGLHYTNESDLTASLAIPAGTNLFSLSTEPLATRVMQLTTVAGVELAVHLPDSLSVRVREREPILVWAVGERRYLVDRAGVLFAEAPSAAGSSGLPTLTDRRAASVALAVGAMLDPIDLDAATRLGSVRPADVGSVATSLGVAVTDENGFVVGASPAGWTAVFGFYTPSLRTPALIPGQVRLLRSLLADREATIERVILASETSGTFIARPSAGASKSPRP